MKKNLFIFLTIIGMTSLFTACERDGELVTMTSDPVAPTLTTVPNLTLLRTNGTQVLEFVGTPVDPGFQASATYYLEACAEGNNFADPVTVWSGNKPESIKITVSDLNGALIKKFPPDAILNIDFRLRAVLIVDAGTGAPGTGTNPFSYSSDRFGTTVTLYGLPRLELVGSGMEQKIESALGDGKYSGLVKFNILNPFTLRDPDAGIVYGAAGAALAVNGAAITPPANGWYKLNADVNALTYETSEYAIGLVGSATPNGWDVPDQKMDYNPAAGTWSITLTLIDGMIKFRMNDKWDWNLGGTQTALTHGGPDIPVTAGNYTIILKITNDVTGSETGTFTIVKN